MRIADHLPAGDAASVGAGRAAAVSRGGRATDVVERIRPRLGQDAVFLPSGTGVFFRNDGISFTVSEPGSYELIRRLAPEFTGRLSLSDICSRHDTTPRTDIIRLVEMLLDHGILRDEGERSDPASDAIRRRFTATLAFLDAIADRPEERFARVRATRMLLVGGGISFWHCAAALVRNGLERLWLVDRDPGGDGRREIDRELAALERFGLPARVHVGRTADDIAHGGPDRPSLVLYVADAPSLIDLFRAGRRALADSCAVMPALVVDDQILLGPLSRAPACPVCTFARLAHEIWDRHKVAALVERIETTNGSMRSGGEFSEPLARRLGSDAAFEAVKMLAGHLRPDLERGMIVQTRRDASPFVRGAFVPCTSHWCRGGCRIFADRHDAAIPG